MCAAETRRFNTEAAGLGEDVQVLAISVDLPFAQSRWCGAAGVNRLTTLSDYRATAFVEAYCVLIKELRLLAGEISSWKIDNVSMECLSMGMTGDFEVAIEEGANIVRIGTAIFGPRG